MPFVYTDRLRSEYLEDGFTILREIVPATLLADLRRESDKARELARQKFGPQTQRLQPVFQYSELHHQPFLDFLDLPGMQTVRLHFLGPEHQTTRNMGILLEPAEQAWCTHWHRDWGYNVPDLEMDAFFAACRNPGMFCQFNAALYDDYSLWAVPGSHNREDTPEEQVAFSRIPPPEPDLRDAGPEEREQRCQRYVRQMPGAVPVPLFAGDVAIYRACCWHLGTYIPYTKRATLHDNFVGPDDLAWRDEVPRMQARVRAAPSAT